MNINTGPLTREVYEICCAHEKYPASIEQTELAVRLSALGDKIELAESQLTEVRAKLEAAENITKGVLRAPVVETAGNLELGSRLEAAEKEIAEFKANNRYMRGHTAGYAEGAADLTAAQADVARLQSDKPFTCFKCGTDGPQMMCPNCANSAAASREAALVMERDDLKNHFTENSLRGRIESAATREAALVKALEALKAGVVEVLMPAVNSAIKSGYVITMFSPEDMQWAKAMELTDAALARCSPPAAETEGQG